MATTQESKDWGAVAVREAANACEQIARALSSDDETIAIAHYMNARKNIAQAQENLISACVTAAERKQ